MLQRVKVRSIVLYTVIQKERPFSVVIPVPLARKAQERQEMALLVILKVYDDIKTLFLQLFGKPAKPGEPFVLAA
jgi:hypothetical protein